MTTGTAADAERILAECCITAIGPGGASERVILLTIAYDLGVTRYEVMCDRCSEGPMSLAAFITRHYGTREHSHREAVRMSGELGDEWAALNPGLHKPGDARLAYEAELHRPAPAVGDWRENPSGVA